MTYQKRFGITKLPSSGRFAIVTDIEIQNESIEELTHPLPPLFEREGEYI